jgi:hypothetical protein
MASPAPLTPRETYLRNTSMSWLGNNPTFPVPNVTPVAADHWAAFWSLLQNYGYAAIEQSLAGHILWARVLEQLYERSEADPSTADAMWAMWRGEAEALVKSAANSGTLLRRSGLLLAELHALLAFHAGDTVGTTVLIGRWVLRPAEYMGDATFTLETDRGLVTGITATTTTPTAVFGPAPRPPYNDDARDVTGGITPEVYFAAAAPGCVLEVHVTSTAGVWTNYAKAVIDTSTPYRGRPTEIPVTAFTTVGTGADFSAIHQIRFKVTGGLATVHIGGVGGRKAV